MCLLVQSPLFKYNIKLLFIMDFANDRKGQINISGIVIGAVIGLIMLTVYFGVYSAMNLAQLDATSKMVISFLGVLLSLVIFVGVARFLQ